MDAIIELPGQAAFSDRGLAIPDGISFDEWARIGQKIGRASSAFQLAVGDWLVYGLDHFKGQTTFPGIGGEGARRVSVELLDYACNLTGMDRQQLSDYASVARKVPCSLRNEQLTYQHFRVLSKLDQPEQKQWVALACGSSERVPTRQLSKSIALAEKTGEARIYGKDEIEADMVASKPAFLDAPEPVLDRFIRSMERQDFSGWTSDMKANLWRRFEAAHRLMEEMGVPA